MAAIKETPDTIKSKLITHVEDNCPKTIAFLDEHIDELVDFSGDRIVTDFTISTEAYLLAKCEVKLDVAGKYLAAKGFRIRPGNAGGIFVSYD